MKGITKFILIILLLQRIHCSKQTSNFGLSYQTTIQDKLPNFIKNIDYLGQGYNIFYGNPHSTEGLDPGYFNYSILKIDYDDDIMKTLSPDRNWIVPSGVRLNAYNTCNTSYTSKQISSMEKYTSSLEVSVSARTRTIGARFSASADYKQMNSKIKSQESLFVESSAQCIQFEATFHESKSFQPRLTTSMASVLKVLEKKGDNEDAYHDFFDKYGTHVITSLKLGSSFGYRFEMSVESVKTMKQKGFSVTASASTRVASGSFGISKDAQSASAFEQATKTWKQYSVGALPNAENDVAKWAAQSMDNPMPIESRLVEFGELLQIFTQRDAKGFTAGEISNLQRRFRTYLDTYCQNRLQANGIVDSCEDSDAQISDADLSEKFNTFFDRLVKNGKQEVLIMNLKSNRFLRPESTQQYLRQFYYDGSEDFLFTFEPVDGSSVGTYFIKHKVTGKCIQPVKCNFDDKGQIFFENCNGGLCQQWGVQEDSNLYNRYRIYSKNSGKYLTVWDRNEGENEKLMQYKNHDCDGCNIMVVWTAQV